MGKYDLAEVRERIEETRTWEPSTEKSMVMKALGSLLLARMGQTTFKDGIFLEREQMRLPNILNRFFHLFPFLHTWLEYDDANVFDGTRRICLICGKTESSIMRRDLAYYESCSYGLLDLKELLAYVKSQVTSERRTPE